MLRFAAVNKCNISTFITAAWMGSNQVIFNGCKLQKKMKRFCSRVLVEKGCH